MPDRVPDRVPRWGDRRRIRVGLLGGSFNPAHAGHLHIARIALARLRLHQVWLMVSPGNPLKATAGMARFTDRMASALALADGRRIVATSIEARMGTRYTFMTLRALRRRFPRIRFVWIMGADNLVQLPRWQRWVDIVRATPCAVMPRPTYNQRALASQAVRRLRRALLPARSAPTLALRHPPAWTFLPARQNGLSATSLRATQGLTWPPHHAMDRSILSKDRRHSP